MSTLPGGISRRTMLGKGHNTCAWGPPLQLQLPFNARSLANVKQVSYTGVVQVLCRRSTGVAQLPRMCRLGIAHAPSRRRANTNKNGGLSRTETLLPSSSLVAKKKF